MLPIARNGAGQPQPAFDEEWARQGREPLPVPYLTQTDRPQAPISIDRGRQLFIDDFLLESSTLKRTFHQARKHPNGPVLRPETPLELNEGRCPFAAPFNDGCWYDPADELFKLWYHAGWFDGTALAISEDGLHWQRPEFDVMPGTNAVVAPRPGYLRDGSVIWLDHDASPDQRYKMFQYYRWPDGKSGEISTSADGIHWRRAGPTSICGDNTSFFYNPFRRKFVFSIRESWGYRARAYYEHKEFAQAATWIAGAQQPWARADRLDLPDPLVGDRPQLYDVNGIAYESIMLGTFAIFYGPQNEVCAEIGQPKFIDLQLAYSRDGFHWHRPDRTPFIPCSRQPDTWDYGYIHATGGVCLVVGDELWFYFAGLSGESPVLGPGESGDFSQSNKMYAGGSTGLAILRRDGFASMDADAVTGSVTTHPLTFSGRRLFVNLDAPAGELRVELLGLDGHPLPGFSGAECLPLAGDHTRIMVAWEQGDDLSRLAGEPVRIRFNLTNGSLYAFWVSPDDTGKSLGYVAAGGPGFAANMDN